MGQVECWSALKTISLTKIFVIRLISACPFHDERFVCSNLISGHTNISQKIIEEKRRVCEPLQPVLPPYSTASLHITLPSQLCK